ncbi:MAG: EthD family reductase, partial [Verrucomicrobiales bacterium]
MKRKAGMSREEFKRRWLIDHTKLSSHLPDCREYRINIALDHQPNGDGVEPVYDGTAELWWDSVASMERCFSTEI